MKTILDSQASRRLFMSAVEGFAVPVTTKPHHHDSRQVDTPVHYSPATCTLHEQRRGVDGVSYRAGWSANYVVRVWPKHNDTRFRMPPPKEDTRTFDEAIADIKASDAWKHHKGGSIDPASIRVCPPGTYTRRTTEADIANAVAYAKRMMNK